MSDPTRKPSMPDENPFASLEKLFHEPARMAIVSELCGAHEGLSFVSLKEDCGLTDGNLSRHLDKLSREGVVTIDKAFVGARPRTTIHLTDAGRAKFVAYLQALEAVLRRAADAISHLEPAQRVVCRASPKTVVDLGT